MGSVLDKIGQGLVSFGSGVPRSEIDRIRAERDIAEDQARITEVQATQAEGEPDRLRRQQELMEKAFSDGPEAEQAMEQLFIENPKLGGDVFDQLGAQDERDRERIARRAFEIENTPHDQRTEVIDRIVAEGAAQGFDMRDTASLLAMAPAEQDKHLKFMRMAALTEQQRAGSTRRSEAKLGAQVLTTDDQGNSVINTPVLKNGVLENVQLPLEGNVVSRQFGETGREQTDRRIDEAGGRRGAEEAATTAALPERAAVKQAATRRTENIQKGIVAADSVAVLNRGIALLDSVETGGFNAAALKAKQTFGFESGDEAELSNSMGKAVLAQLRDTFGAAFTAQEGQSLKEIEANFGKSTEGNKRLLKRAKRLVDRVIQRGIDSAIENEDFGAAQQIKEARDFNLAPEPEAAEETFEERKARILKDRDQ